MTLRFVRRVIVGVVGGTMLLIGLAMIVLPGPAFVVIPAGLAVLATEFVWAQRWLRQAKQMIVNATSKRSSEKTSNTASHAVANRTTATEEDRSGRAS